MQVTVEVVDRGSSFPKDPGKLSISAHFFRYGYFFVHLLVVFAVVTKVGAKAGVDVASGSCSKR